MNQSAPAEYISFIDIAVAVLRRRRLIARACLTAGFATGALIIARGREYASEARFVPDAGTANVGALSGLAAQFGLAAALGGGSQSPDFYAALAKSRTVLGAIADSSFRFEHTRNFILWRDTVVIEGTIAELYNIDRPKSRARERDEAIELIDELVTSGASLETGVITIRAQTDWPQLSYQVSRLVLDQISKYNLSSLQSRASAERKFVEDRLESQRQELASEEDSLRIFLEKNRLFTASPQLVIEHERLQRKVALRQQVVIGLAQAYEQARIEEVRNTPVITMVQEPEVPAKGVRRNLPLKVLLAMVLTLVVFGGIAIVREAAKDRETGHQPTTEELSVLWLESREDFRRLFRRT